MKKVAIVIPVHSSGNKYFKELLDTFTEENAKYCDLYFVFDNKLELAKTTGKSDFPTEKIWNELFVEDEAGAAKLMNSFIRSRNKCGAVTFKKLYGLEQVSKLNKHDYLMCIDVDSRFLCLKNAYKICESFHTKKKLYGAETQVPDSLDINKQSIEVLEKSGIKIDEKKIQRNIGVWFSQIPIYEVNTLREFLNDIDFSSYEDFSKKFSAAPRDNMVFSYIIYAYYCVNSKGYEMVDIRKLGLFLEYDQKTHGGSMEHEYDLEFHMRLRKLGIDRNWKFGDCPTLEEHIIHYHVNRKVNDKGGLDYDDHFKMIF